jgi:hypothetical protein
MVVMGGWDPEAASEIAHLAEGADWNEDQRKDGRDGKSPVHV